MIVYSSSIWLEGSTRFDDIFSQITYWLHKKTGDNIFPQSFLNVPMRSFIHGETLEVYKTDEHFPQIYCFRYVEKDQEVAGRQWTTEIGIKRETKVSDIQCAFLVQTSEISPIVQQPSQTTRPRLISTFLEKFKATKKTAGLEIIELNELSDAEALSYEIDFDFNDRDYPIILVSPDESGEYLVDLDFLLYQTKGLAKVVKITPEVDSYKVSNTLGKTHSAYNGAINILFPKVKKGLQEFIPTKLLLPDTIIDITEQGKNVVLEILTLISHRMNLPNFWQHISPERVKEAQRKRDIERLRKDIAESGKQEEYIKLLEDSNVEKESEIEILQNEMKKATNESDYYLQEFEKSEDDRKIQQNKASALEAQLDLLKFSRQRKGELEDCSEVLRELVEKLYEDSITPGDSLDLISRLYPDRIIILESAYKSAKDSQAFKEKMKVFNLLWKLVNEYWESLNEGKGDTIAKQIFGDDFAAKESDGVEAKKTARNRRTFTYNGQAIEMMKHLKIGKNENAIDTIRIHFEWMNEDKKVVVGYCGPHLDFD
jgi:hypothetical protein